MVTAQPPIRLLVNVTEAVFSCVRKILLTLKPCAPRLLKPAVELLLDQPLKLTPLLEAVVRIRFPIVRLMLPV